MPTNVIMPQRINSRSGDEAVAVQQQPARDEDRNGLVGSRANRHREPDRTSISRAVP